MHILLISILRLSVPELCATQSDHITIRVNAHATCHVTYHQEGGGGAKMLHIFENPEPKLPIKFVIFRALRRRLSHVIGEK